MRSQNANRKANPLWPVIIILTTAVLLFGLVWVQYSASNTYREQLVAAINDLKNTGGNTLIEEKTRQEALKLRLENEQRSIFLQTLLSTISTSMGIIVAVSGMWIAFAQYMNAKERERLDRASKDLEDIWKGIANSGDPNTQAAAIAALQHFLPSDKAEYHERVAAALALVSRMKDKAKIVEETLKPIIEKAMRQITNSMRNVSWQGSAIEAPDFSGLDLNSFDFRDSNLPEANFRNSNLTNTRFDASRLIRACFECATMHESILDYADLADANFRLAKLKGASLRHIQLMNMDLAGADLQGARLSTADTDWRLIRDWRTAKFSRGIKEQLIANYGPPVHGPRVLMLTWEFLPKVSGGLWTAVYHFLRNLRSRGANISVAVPLASKEVSFFEFGNEIRLFPLGGGTIVSDTFTTYDDKASTKTPSVTLPYNYNMTVIEHTEWFASAALESVEQQNLEFDIIHAHDWLTFPAAQALAKRLNCPWVAHFHSTEEDRRPGDTNNDIKRIEMDACQYASAIVTPSLLTKTRLNEQYAVSLEKVQIVPNCLSLEKSVVRIPPRTREKKRVVFLGRLTKQKGPDYFVNIARHTTINMNRKDITFVCYGTGDMKDTLESSSFVPSQEETTYPDPQTVIPAQKGSLQRFSSPIDIWAIAPADYDMARNRVDVHEKKEGKQKEQLIDFVFAKGFVAHGCELGNEGNYTHTIELVGELPEGVGKWYCINATGLKQTSREFSDGWSFVSFEGEVAWNNRKRILQDASLVIVPSRFEPFGMVVLEAMQMGIPVLYDKSAGVSEVVSSGVQIGSTSAEDVSNKIIELVDNEGKWLTYAEAALEEVTEYPMRGYEQKLMDLWTRLLNS